MKGFFSSVKISGISTTLGCFPSDKITVKVFIVIVHQVTDWGLG